MYIRRFLLFCVLAFWFVSCGFEDDETEKDGDSQRVCEVLDCSGNESDGKRRPGISGGWEEGFAPRIDDRGDEREKAHEQGDDAQADEDSVDGADSEEGDFATGDGPDRADFVDSEDEDSDDRSDNGDSDDGSSRDSNDVDDGDDSDGWNPDLQCAADPSICRFCGPVQAMVTDCPAGDTSFECQVFELVNDIRVDEGLEPLHYNATLAESAMIHAMDLSLCDYFAHDSLDGTSFFDRCDETGYDGTCTGENVGGGQSSPQAVVDAWMDSPGHKENILYPHHTEVGVAFYEGDGFYTRYWVKNFGRDD